MDYAPMLRYIDEYWHKLTRTNPQDEGTLIGLPYPYVVPGVGAMFQEMYYWDSYFAALGLADTPHEQLVVDMTNNMAYLLRRFGVIPNGTRYYFLSRSQPPFFLHMVELAHAIKQRRGDADTDSWRAAMHELGVQEHQSVWQGTAQPHHRLVHEGLSRYFDINFLDMLASCESGWDHSTRCDDRWLAHLPVDLNAILYAREQLLARATQDAGQDGLAASYQAVAETRAATMRRLHWDEDASFFLDYDYVAGRRNPTPTLAGFYPLWAGIATQEQADRAVVQWLPRFEQRGGLVSSLDSREGRQWAWPNGWAPLQYIAVEGLARYGFVEEAQRLRQRWCDLCATMLQRTGVLWEKYNVVDPDAEAEGGLYGHVTGFGWTNGVVVDFVRKLEGA